MNKFLSEQIFSFLLLASLLLSFWTCVENCQAEAEHNSEASHAALQNEVENTEKDSCSVQTALFAFLSNQEMFVSAGLALHPNHSWKIISRQTFLPVLLPQTEESFSELPFQILRQMRV